MTTSPPRESDDPVADARALIAWADRRFGAELCVTASFGDAVLAHLVATTIPHATVTLLDTGYLFAETEWFADDLRRRYRLDLRIVHPEPDIDRDVWQYDTEACCRQRKVEPLNRALEGHRAWMTGLRRDDSPSRASTPWVADDLLRGVTKLNPIAGWTDKDVERYTAEHDLPAHPLADRGYASIGCWPCTRPAVGDDPRSGRWADSDKTECGLHLR